MLEAYGSLDELMNYYGTTSAPGGHFPFNFRLIADVNYSSSAVDISRIINEYLDRTTDGRTPNWVVRTWSVSRLVLFIRQASRGH
jgi:alpha-glucosidase